MTGSVEHPDTLPEDLAAFVATLRRERIDGNQQVDYEGYRKSPEYWSFLKLLRRLEALDLKALGNGARARAFWINFYNAATVHSVVQYGAPGSSSERKRFFGREGLVIGGASWSLSLIEHGVLRGNRRPPYTFSRPLSAKDPRLEVVLDLDPRIHFALNCGARSCPAISHYVAENLEDQLDMATSSFIDQEVRIEGRTLTLSEIFRWYSADFGNVLEFVGRHSDDQRVRDLCASGRAKIRYSTYDWHLNGLY